MTEPVANTSVPPAEMPIDPTKLPLPAGTLTQEESQVITKVLFTPTVVRMTVLTRTLIDQTQTADHACWAPLAVMERMITSLPLADHPVPGAAFLDVLNLALLRMAGKVYDYRIAVAEALQTGGPWPAWPEWTLEDTQFCYAPPEPETRPTEPAVDGPPA